MNRDYICLFSVICYIDEENVEEHGFCHADSFVDAVKYLENELYCKNLIEITHMELIDACPVLSKDTWDRVRRELNEG